MLILLTFTALALELEPCPSKALPTAECGTALLPLDHPSRTGSIPIAYTRLPAPSQPARGQLWFLTGGPGDSGIADLAAIAGLHDEVPDLDLYAFDPRGVGESGAIRCPAQEAPKSREGSEIVDEEWSDCAQHVAENHAHVLPWLTTTQTAHDLLALVDRARGPDDEVYLWGVSYGTFLANRALLLRPDDWSGVVLDGVVPPDWTFLEFDTALDEVARDHLRLCADQPECLQRLGPTPVAYANDVLERLEDGHCKRLGLDADLTRLVHGVFLIGGDPYASLAPPLFYRLERCKPRDIGAFVHLFDTLFPEEGDGIATERGGHNAVLQRQIIYADLWGEAPPIKQLERDIARSIATTRVTLQMAEVSPEWPEPPIDPLSGVPATTGAPVLLLHGGLDPTMPLERVRPWLASFDGAHQTAIEVPFAYHVTANAGDCPMALTADFFLDPTAPVDASCVADMPMPDFESNPELDEAVWGRDRWGDPRSCLDGSAAFLVFLPLLGLRRRR